MRWSIVMVLIWGLINSPINAANIDEFMINIHYLKTNTQGQVTLKTEARTAHSNPKHHTTVFDHPRITLLTTDTQGHRQTTHIQANQGMMNPSQDMHLTQQVQIKTATLTLKTKTLTIDPKTAHLSTKSPIVIQEKGSIKPRHAKADFIDYNTQTGKIHLQGHAQIDDATHHLTSDAITYDTSKQTFHAQKNHQHPVTMVITPDA